MTTLVRSLAPPLLSAGTQVVALAAALGTNETPVHPRGAVGIVTRTPAGVETDYLVRFPDGFESSFTRDQLEVLKDFKDRLGGGSPAFDLESVVIYRCIVGSRAYGLDTDSSDTDLRGVYLAPADLQWSLYGAPEQFEDNAAQTCYCPESRFHTRRRRWLRLRQLRRE